MSIYKKDYTFILIHLLIISILYSMLYFSGFITIEISDNSILKWDAGWYFSIVEYGYNYLPNQQSNVNFFPLFPILWKILGACRPILISIVNIAMFLGGILILKKTFQFKNAEGLIFLSFPSMIFCMLPFSEAIFFLSGTITLYGLNRGYRWVTIIGIFFLTMTRSIGLLLIPVFIFTELVGKTAPNEVGNAKETILNILSYICAVIVALAIVGFIQWYYTGRWFDFLSTQEQWGRSFGLPHWAFSTIQHQRMYWIDGLSFWVTIIAILLVSGIGIRWLKVSIKSDIDKAMLFSLGYLSTIFVALFFYSQKMYYPNNYVAIGFPSANRYVFATPFLLVAFLYVRKYIELTSTQLLIGTVLAVVVVFFSIENPEITYYQDTLMGVSLISYAILLMLLVHKELFQLLWKITYAIQVGLFMTFIVWYIQGLWIG